MIKIQFFKPSEISQFTLETNGILVGDAHILMGEVFLIGGAPGVGKSKAGLALAVAGATGEPWFGLPVKRKFKTMVVQNENGPFRLHQDINEIKNVGLNLLDEYIKISTPPPLGLDLKDTEFVNTLVAAIVEFQPGVLFFDPWNAMNDEEDSKTYGDTFRTIKQVLAKAGVKPAIGIICHTRKGKPEHKPDGRDLLKEVLGPTRLASVARSAFVMKHVTTSSTDTRIIFTCCKNNNGELGEPSCWELKNGLFTRIEVDLESLISHAGSRKVIELSAVEQVFDDAPEGLSMNDAVKKLIEITGFVQSTCYNALNVNSGKFQQYLQKSEDGLLHFVPSPR